MEYYRFNDRFEDIITNEDSVIDEIFTDISIVIDHFYKVERGLI